MTPAILNVLTYVLILGTFAVWIAWDVYLASKGAATESMTLRQWGEHCTFFPHLIGFLCGHWFFPHDHLWRSGWMWGLGVWGLLGLYDIAWAIWGNGGMPWYRYSGLWLLVGIACGTFLWGQTP